MAAGQPFNPIAKSKLGITRREPSFFMQMRENTRESSEDTRGREMNTRESKGKTRGREANTRD